MHTTRVELKGESTKSSAQDKKKEGKKERKKNIMYSFFSSDEKQGKSYDLFLFFSI